VSEVTLVTGLGRLETYEEFVRSKLQPNVKPVFSYIDNVQTVTKRRFVDSDMGKLFEIYFFSPDPALNGIETEVAGWIKEHASEYDAVIVPDFGNGFISSEMVSALCESSRFLAVNTQVNSGNKGHHVITRYRRADFVSLNEPELRLATHNRHDPLEVLAENVGERVNASWVAVTRGAKGLLMRDHKAGELHRVPALSTTVLDRIGAGDAFLSLAGLCLSGGLPAELSAFVGSVAAALDVQIVCNREPITAVNLYRYITTLLK
jgi:bifunctional ADP-heptose synthase (sugar kinase/adenylyltransferase)